MHRLANALVAGTTLVFGQARLLQAATYTLDAPLSSIPVVFDDSNARLTVTDKADGFVWKNPDTGGGSTLAVTGVSQPSATNITIAGHLLTLAFELVARNGELRVTLGGTNSARGCVAG